MKKINLKNYTVEGLTPQGETVVAPYDIKASIINIVLSKDLRLNGAELLEANKVAMQVDKCEDDEILLEEVTHAVIVKAVNTVRGLAKRDVEFVRRILEAETVEVKEK